MYKFITIRCRCCHSVICNLPEKDFKKLKLISLVCEDCTHPADQENPESGMESPVIQNTMQVI